MRRNEQRRKKLFFYKDIVIAVLTYKVLHGTAQRYLSPLIRVSNLPFCQQ